MVKILKNKKDKIVTLSFPKFVSFHQSNAQEELRICEIFFTILLTKILIDNRKGVFYLIKNKKDKKLTNNRGRFFKQKITFP